MTVRHRFTEQTSDEFGSNTRASAVNIEQGIELGDVE